MGGKFDLIETGYSLSPFTALATPPLVVPSPNSVICNPRLLQSSDGSLSYTIDVSWTAPLNLQGTREVWVTSYYVEFKRGDSGTWGNRQEVSQLYARYENVGSGTFYARVAAVIAANGKVSQWRESGAGNLTTVQAIADASAANYSFFVTEM